MAGRPTALVFDISVGPLAPLGQITLPHDIRAQPTGVTCDDPSSPIACIAVDVYSATFFNQSTTQSASATFRVSRSHTLISNPRDLVPFLWKGNTTSGGGGGPGVEQFTAENKDVVPIQPGQVVAIHASGSGIVRGGGPSNLVAAGLATALIAVAAAGAVQVGGVLSLPDWSAATGSPALAPGEYFADAVQLGMLTQAPPAGSGILLQSLGRPALPASFDILLGRAILL